jgi:type II secretory pathway component GspD/PulD (secretin)
MTRNALLILVIALALGTAPMPAQAVEAGPARLLALSSDYGQGELLLRLHFAGAPGAVRTYPAGNPPSCVVEVKAARLGSNWGQKGGPIGVVACAEPAKGTVRLALAVFQGAQWFVERPSPADIVVHFPTAVQMPRTYPARLAGPPRQSDERTVERLSANGDASAAFLTVGCSGPVEYRVAADGSAGTFAIVLRGARLGPQAARDIVLPPGPVSRASAKAVAEGVSIVLALEGRPRCEVVRNLKGDALMIKVESLAAPSVPSPTLPVRAVAANLPTMFFAAEDSNLTVPTVLAPLTPVVRAPASPALPPASPVLISAAPEEAAVPAPIALPTVFAAAPPPDKRLVNLDFVNADLVDVFKVLAYQSGRDIAVDGAVQGTVTLRLTEVPLEQALDLICRLNNLAYVEFGKSYVVASREKIAPLVEAVSEVYQLQVVPPDEAVKLLQVIEPALTVIPQAETKSLVLVGSREALARARGFLNTLERPGIGPEVGAAVEATEVVKVENVSAEDVVSLLSAALPGLGVSAQAKLKMVTLRGTAAAVAEGKRLLQQIDVPTVVTQAVKIKAQDLEQIRSLLLSTYPQLNVESHPELGTLVITGPKTQVDEALRLVASVDVAAVGPQPGTPAGLAQEVIELNYLSMRAAESAVLNFPNVKISVPPSDDKANRRVLLIGPAAMVAMARSTLAQLDQAPSQVMIEAMVTDFSEEDLKQTGLSWDLGTVGVSEVRNEGGFKFGAFSRSSLEFLGTITAAITRGTSKLLAQPRILALDGETARVLSGQRIMIQTQQIIAGAVTTTIQEVRVGIELEITPRVAPDGYIICKVKPQVSNVGGYTPQGLPIIVTREAESTARVADGQTMVIGGLIKDEEVRSLTRIPFISEVPLLGELFKRRTVTSRPSELVIFVTPRIVRSEGGKL